MNASVVNYLEQAPPAARIVELAAMLGVPVAALLRRGEEVFRNACDLPELDDDGALAAWIERHPKALERPIVVNDVLQRAIIGRPPENVLQLIEAGNE